MGSFGTIRYYYITRGGVRILGGGHMVAGGRREDQSLSTEYKVGGVGRENVENYGSSNCH